MLRSLVSFMVVLTCVVIMSVPAIADGGDPTADPYDPGGVAKPTPVFEDAVVDVIQHVWRALWLVIL